MCGWGLNSKHICPNIFTEPIISLKAYSSLHYLYVSGQGHTANTFLSSHSLKEKKSEALNNSDIIEEKLEVLLGKYQSNLRLICVEDILCNDMSRVIILGTLLLALQSLIDHWLWNEMPSTYIFLPSTSL